MAMFGLQWGIIPIIIMNLSNVGYDYFTPMWMMGCYGQVGVALAVFLRPKSPELKQLSLTAFLSGLFTGITEPILYGILTKNVKLNIFVVIGVSAVLAFLFGFKNEKKMA